MLPSPVRSAFDAESEDEVVVNIGPSHPATHGTLQVIAALDGEKVQARRRALRLPASRLREGVRVAHLAQPDAVRRPPQLLLGADQRLRLLRRGRDADGHRDHAALPLPAHAAVGVLAHLRPPDVHRGVADGARRDDRVPLSRDAARPHVRAPGGADRRARDLHLRAHRRPRARPARRLARAPRRDPRASSTSSPAASTASWIATASSSTARATSA